MLVIDDWGLTTPKDAERRDLMEIVEDRHGARSTVITSQLPVDKWHDHLGDRRSLTQSATACCTVPIGSY